ncbi:MAG: uroporphyrinogen decarboxylase family protein [Candidatus Latescibacterota bacterium]
MIPKQRVLKTFASQVPDRVPINYQAETGIDARLKKHFRLAPNDDEGLRVALGVDFRSVNAPYVGPRLHQDMPERGVRVSDWGVRQVWIANESSGYWDYCDFPLREATPEQIAGWPLPNPDDYDYSQIYDQCRRYAPYAISGSGGYGDIINGNSMLRNMEQTLIDLVTDEPAGLLLADRRMKIQLEVTERILDAARGQVDFIWLGEDLGTQIAPLISLKTFRKHIRPRYQWFCDLAEAYDVSVMIHTCGSSSWAYEDFIEMGVHVVDTLQPEAVHMAPAYLKEHFGGRLAFHGCISTAGPVAYGTVEEVTAYCRDILATMMPGGGYCFAPTHCLQDNSPTENVVAMYQTARNFGRY